MSGPYRSVFRDGLFAGRVVMVTGGGSGIGRCTAHELARLGAMVVLVGRNPEKLQATAIEIADDGGRASFHVCDIRNEAGVKAMVADAVQAHGRIDGLVNNAGGQYITPLEKISAKGWQAVIDTNLTGGFLVARECYLQSMAGAGRRHREHRRGHVGFDARHGPQRRRPHGHGELHRDRRDGVGEKRRARERGRTGLHRLQRHGPLPARGRADAARDAPPPCRWGASATRPRPRPPSSSCSRPRPASSAARCCGWTARGRRCAWAGARWRRTGRGAAARRGETFRRFPPRGHAQGVPVMSFASNRSIHTANRPRSAATPCSRASPSCGHWKSVPPPPRPSRRRCSTGAASCCRASAWACCWTAERTFPAAVFPGGFPAGHRKTRTSLCPAAACWPASDSSVACAAWWWPATRASKPAPSSRAGWRRSCGCRRSRWRTGCPSCTWSRARAPT